MLPIYVIHIESATERAEIIKTQFEKIGINFIFFPAINGHTDPDHPLFKHYNKAKHFKRKGRSLSLGELGCFASHYSLWKKCIEKDKPIIILEDDILLLENFRDFYYISEEISNKYSFLWLHKNYRNNEKIAIENIDNFSIVKFKRDYFCAQGYMLTPKAAQKLLSYCEEWFYPVDDQMARFYENHTTLFALYPPCIDKEDNITSLIGDNRRGNKKISPFSKLRREYYYMIDRIKRFKYNLRYQKR